MPDLANTLVSQALAQGWVQWVSFFSGILYIFYAARNNPWCWPWGILSSGLWAYASWFQLHLLSDALLQLIYVILGIIGWYQWVRGKPSSVKNSIVLPVTGYPPKTLFILLIGSLLPALLLGYIMHFTRAAFPYIDAFLAVYSLLATWMLVNRKLENWLLWIVIDFLSIPLFILREGHLFALLFLIYGLLAIKGWKTWRTQLITHY
jgi:nicotinamide mononucleotide transporter